METSTDQSSPTIPGKTDADPYLTDTVRRVIVGAAAQIHTLRRRQDDLRRQEQDVRFKLTVYRDGDPDIYREVRDQLPPEVRVLLPPNR